MSEQPARPEPAVVAVRSADLFRGAREVIIVHHDEQYRLRITRAGKLILTK
jgi:hemin uptake protein HemP